MSKTKDGKVEIREVVYSQDDDKSFGDIFIYEPENVEEQNVGNLFIVGELRDLPRNCSYVVNLLASKIKKEFYSNTKRGAEESLEAGLSVANQTLAELAEQGNGEYLGKLSMICGTYRGKEFYLSQVGKIKSLLIRDGQITEIMKEESGKAISSKRVFNDIASGELTEGDLVILATSGLFNIFSMEELRQTGSSLGLDEFSVKLQEEIEEEDKEIVSALIMEIEGKKSEKLNRVEITESIPAQEETEMPVEILSEKTENYPQEQEAEERPEQAEPAQDNIEDKKENAAKYPKSKTGYYSENAIETNTWTKKETEKNEDESKDTGEYASDEEEKVVIRKPSAKKQRGKKEEQEKEAEEIKEPSLFSFSQDEQEKPQSQAPAEEEITKKGSDKVSLSDIIKEYEKRESKTVEENSQRYENIEKIAAKRNTNGFDDLDGQTEALHMKVAGTVGKFLKNVDLKQAKTPIANIFNKTISRKKEYGLPSVNKKSGILSKKKIAAAIIAMLVLSGAGVYYSNYNKGVQEKKEANRKLASYQEILASSRSKMDAAEMELVSGTKENAGKFFAEAKNLALQVKNEYAELGSEADSVIAKAQEEINKIDRVEKLSSLETIATFDNADIRNIIEANGSYYAIDNKENSVYKIDTKNGKLVQSAKAENAMAEIKFAGNYQDQEILLSDGTNFSSFSIKNTNIEKMEAIASSSIKDLVVYGRNVYLLSPSNNQIYKYQRPSQELTGKTEWLKSGDVKDAVSMTIDQYIFILTSDGQVKKYFTGSEFTEPGGKKYAIEQPSEKITDSAKIRTSLDQKYLYILDPAKGRILIYDKATGALIKQLANENFADLRDISVDNKETAIMALVNNKIIRIDLAK